MQLNELELAKWFEDVLEITLSDAEMNIANIEPMEWSRVLIAGTSLGITCLTVLFRFSQLNNDGDCKEVVSGKLEGALDRFLEAKFDIANTGNY